MVDSLQVIACEIQVHHFRGAPSRYYLAKLLRNPRAAVRRQQEAGGGSPWRRGGSQTADDGAHPRDSVSADHEQRELPILYGTPPIHRAHGGGFGAVRSAHAMTLRGRGSELSGRAAVVCLGLTP